MNTKRWLVLLLAAATTGFGGNAAAELASQARDAAAAFVATQNFVVGRIGRDCLEVMGRSESPAEYRETWRENNASYYKAATRYIEARFAAIEDPAERARVESGYYNAVNGTGDAAADQILSKGEREDVCRNALAMIDSGRMNIDEFVSATDHPVQEALNELLEWSRRH